MPADARSLTMQLHRLDGMAQHIQSGAAILLPEDLANLSDAERAEIERLVRVMMPGAIRRKAIVLVEQAEGDTP